MKILVFPKDENPYQELLYRRLREQGDEIDYLGPLTKSRTFDLLLFPFRIGIRRLKGYTIFHLHWPSAFSFDSSISHIKPIAFYMFWNYALNLKLIKLFGYKLVWTAHNVLPHEPIFFNDIAARVRLVEAADLVIAHSPTTLEKLEEMGAKPKKFINITHGSYVEAYPNTISSNEARQKLGLEANTFIYLYLGQIRPYKGIENLIQAYSSLKSENNKLIVAGKSNDLHLRSLLRNIPPTSNVLWFDKFIDDADLQIYFAAANVVVLPFNKITTSGSALLALSFGKAVIVPKLGDMRYLPEEIAYKYDSSGGIGALEETMRSAERNPDEVAIKSREARIYAEKLDWTSIARKTHTVISELLAN